LLARNPTGPAPKLASGSSLIGGEEARGAKQQMNAKVWSIVFSPSFVTLSKGLGGRAGGCL
jgi:hypothetical protein